MEEAPKNKGLLLWWRPKDENPYAETAVIGQISSYEDGMWWNGQRGEYQPVWHITHWQPLPSPPQGEG
ncbi:DUF551 domain-containing protein [Pelagibius litoralis]